MPVRKDAAALLAEHGNPDELVVRDVDLKGFVLRLRASGHHVYGIKYGRSFLTLGGADRLTAGLARKKAREDLAQRSLAEDGEPERAKRKRATLTLQAFLDEHYEPWAIQHLRTGAEMVIRLRRHFAGLLDRRLVDLSAFEARCREWPLVRECHMLNGEIDFILKCVAPDLSTFQSFLTEQLTAAPNVASVKTSLVIRCAKDEPAVPFDVYEARARARA